MMQLALQTIAAGFRANGFDVVTTGTGARRFLGPTAAAARGSIRDQRDVFVWVGVWDIKMAFSQAKRFASRGALTAFLDTESHEIWDENCTILAYVPFREIWQYTHSNIARCPESKVGKVVRYIPPGYVPRETMAPLAGGRAPRMLFLGGTHKMYDKRRHCLEVAQRSMLLAAAMSSSRRSSSFADSASGTRECSASSRVASSGPDAACPLQSASDAYNDTEWDRYVVRAPYFLNVHKKCNATARASQSACESFRLSMLLAAGAVVFSEHCHPDDEAAYQGLVTFSAVSDLGDAVISEHEAGDHRQRRRARLAAFEARFSPAAIFERAGLTRVFRAACAPRTPL